MNFAPESLRHVVFNLMREKGFAPPLFAITVASNGSTLALRFERDDPHLQPEVLCQYVESEFFLLPINIIMVDSNGRAAHLLLLTGREDNVTLLGDQVPHHAVEL